MSNKKTKSKVELDDSISLLIEDLLELSSIEFDDEKQTQDVEQLEGVIEETFDPTNLASIIKHAKRAGAEANGEKWIDPDKKREDDIISKAKSQGKSAYDSDVLRELILQRQKKKRETGGLSSIISKVKK
ncbi:hypothetical protein [Spiroplasma endosymbiont of Diplazon laetatorius]|uniref:hypothetical protein n=1 Tax=Spiroplasma endosymbiont of Diplazon laetatorius TaxID=3066322 RepID=UPI0030CEDF3A